MADLAAAIFSAYIVEGLSVSPTKRVKEMERPPEMPLVRILLSEIVQRLTREQFSDDIIYARPSRIMAREMILLQAAIYSMAVMAKRQFAIPFYYLRGFIAPPRGAPNYICGLITPPRGVFTGRATIRVALMRSMSSLADSHLDSIAEFIFVAK